MPACAPAAGAERLVFVDDVAPRQRDDEFLPVVGAKARLVADLRLFDRERRALPHLPADHLLEILRARRHLLRA